MKQKEFFIYILCVVFSLLSIVEGKGLKKIHIIPTFNYDSDPNKFFDLSNDDYLYPSISTAFLRLRKVLPKIGYSIEASSSSTDLSNADLIIDVAAIRHNSQASKNWFHKLARYPKEKLILLMTESPAIVPDYFLFNFRPNLDIDKRLYDYYNKVLTWEEAKINGKNILRFFFPTPTLKVIDHTVDFNQKKLCMLASTFRKGNGYDYRRSIVNFFNKYYPNDLDLYGNSWPKHLRIYKGHIPKNQLVVHEDMVCSQQYAINCIRNYKFSFCIENINADGWITERIFDTFLAGSVPIYLGAPNIEEYIPADCFIDLRKFKDHNELYMFLRSITKEQYEEYLNRIRKYLESDEAFFFSIEHFMDVILSILDKNYNKGLIFNDGQCAKLLRMKNTVLYKKFTKDQES